MTIGLTTEEEQFLSENENPGAQLARVREKKGYSQEYVAGKLHLRVRVIELLETDDYQNMPDPVFIKGYLRAYANLVEISPEPLLAAFNRIPFAEKKLERNLWQSRRESYKSERLIRWLTGFLIFGLVLGGGLWWQKNKDNHSSLAENTKQNSQVNGNKRKEEIKLTDLSKMQALLPIKNENTLAVIGHDS